ncbi:hypothetical protein [Ammoniphilus resinae]|uniref:Uncharacterized protein n=1 Tax=Ammoniphilus resinae TaxID=861532 RepID=A0ABS4GL83_9BACL|nr:hypothetical protein [Ammoniphilus resinae]MBP1930862.1 hypothetical protein [Ammoniphilus resinae]
MYPLIQEKATNHQRFLERIEMFSFQLEFEGVKYHYVLYKRFGKPAGILIIDQYGEVIPREEAKPIVATFNYYNNIATGATTDLVRDMNKDITPMLDLDRLLNENAAELLHLNEYQDVRKMLRTIIEGQDQLKVIFEQLKAIDIAGRENRKLVTMDDVKTFMTWNDQYQSILYRNGRIQQENKEAIERLLQYVKGNKATFCGSDRMIDVLEAFLAPHVARTLEQSLETFEKGIDGKRVRFAPDHEGIQQMLVLYKQNTQKETENILYKLLRNP